MIPPTRPSEVIRLAIQCCDEMEKRGVAYNWSSMGLDKLHKTSSCAGGAIAWAVSGWPDKDNLPDRETWQNHGPNWYKVCSFASCAFLPRCCFGFVMSKAATFWFDEHPDLMSSKNLVPPSTYKEMEAEWSETVDYDNPPGSQGREEARANLFRFADNLEAAGL